MSLSLCHKVPAVKKSRPVDDPIKYLSNRKSVASSTHSFWLWQKVCPEHSLQKMNSLAKLLLGAVGLTRHPLGSVESGMDEGMRFSGFSVDHTDKIFDVGTEL